jgi:hypothetical protein
MLPISQHPVAKLGEKPVKSMVSIIFLISGKWSGRNKTYHFVDTNKMMQKIGKL